MEIPTQLFGALQGWIYETLVQPALFYFGLIGYDDQAYDAVELLLYGLMEIGLIYALLRPLEWWRPVERWRDRRAVRVDVLYTLLQRLGFLPLVFFLMLTPIVDSIDASLRMHDIIPRNLEDLIPGLIGSPLLAFCAYLVVLDFAEYWRHRWQHQLRWWWGLHSLHHSQRRMTFWADDRNHVLDDVIGDLFFSAIALIIGVPPGQFIFIVVLTRIIESLSHANVRMGFGRIGDRLLVSPHYHRVHHAIGVGHEGKRYGCNFATLFPIWDVLFRTANFTQRYPRTGIRDQLHGVNYGDGFWEQQWLGIQRLLRGLQRRPAVHALPR